MSVEIYNMIPNVAEWCMCDNGLIQMTKTIVSNVDLRVMVFAALTLCCICIYTNVRLMPIDVN